MNSKRTVTGQTYVGKMEQAEDTSGRLDIGLIDEIHRITRLVEAATALLQSTPRQRERARPTPTQP